MTNTFDRWDKDKLRELSSRAGKASGKARRKKRQLINDTKIANQVYKEIQSERKKNMMENLKMLSMASKTLLEAKHTADYAYSSRRGGNGLKNADIVRYYERILKDHGITDSRSLQISDLL